MNSLRLLGMLACGIIALSGSKQLAFKQWLQLPSELSADLNVKLKSACLWIFSGWDFTLPILIVMIPFGFATVSSSKHAEPWPHRWIVLVCVTFFIACGLTQLVDAAIVWWPEYRPDAILRILIALASLASAITLLMFIPNLRQKSVIPIREAEREPSQLTLLNERLLAEIAQRERTERKFQTRYRELELKAKDLEFRNNELLKREHDLIKNEEKIRLMNTDLEKVIQERTAELNETNRELEAFTYSVSHDLRAPLRAINGYARILEEDFQSRLGNQGNHIINVITKNAHYMGQLIDDLLEFSRTSRAEVRQSLFQTDQEVRKICSDILQSEPNRQIEVDIDPLQSCNGDINMLRQIWVNLISNAIKYTRKTPVAKIKIGSFKKDADICFYISDNGVGFDMEYRDKLFGVFQRLHRKEEFEGTGVGLALVKRILDRHHGRVWAESAVNTGATFYFSLPNK